jgi:hypothetical protein
VLEEEPDEQERDINLMKMFHNLQIEELWLQKQMHHITQACQKVQFCNMDYIHPKKTYASEKAKSMTNRTTNLSAR